MQKLKTYFKNTVIGFLTIVLFSNITFAHSIDFHLCQGELQSVAFFGEKASCSKLKEAEASQSGVEAPPSCCDAKKSQKGLIFKQKSCCDNVQVIQDNVLNKTDVDQSISTPISFINDFEILEVKLNKVNPTVEKVEIPPPPNIVYQHSQENLQVFQI